MSLKRKLSEFDTAAGWLDLDWSFRSPAEETASPPASKIQRRDTNHRHDNSSWRLMGDKAVPSSLPLANMISAVQELIDPEFDPDIGDPDADNSARFLKPLPARISADDVDYLRSKGALTLPDRPLRTELLRAYVQWVYSFMPLLDLHGFLNAIAENKRDAGISLLLFQAVMFAGTAFVDIGHLKAAGFENRRDARKAFSTRARVSIPQTMFFGLAVNLYQLLYSFDYEDDRMVILQALLLLTYYHETDSGLQNDIWYWVGVCNTHAQSIGIHRDPTKSEIDVDTQRLRIRLWWCLYSRDRLVALALRRPTQINEGICDVPFLRSTDFDLKPFSAAATEMLGCGFMRDVSHQRRLATMFIEKVKLCQCLGRVLFAQYMPSNYAFGATQQTTITLVPRQASDAELERCSHRLDNWLRSLPKEATFMPHPSRQELGDGENVLLLHSSMLHMTYHATCTALYRPRASLPPSNSAIKMLTTARQKMRDAASDTADIVHGLNQLGLTKFLPSSSLTVVTPAAVVHLANLTSTNPHVRDESAWNFRQCIDVLNDLKDIYPAADYETACLQRAAQIQYGRTTTGGRNPVFIMMNNNNNTTNPVNSQHQPDDSPNNRIITELNDDDDDDELDEQPEPRLSPSSFPIEKSPASHSNWDFGQQDMFKDWIVSSPNDRNSSSRMLSLSPGVAMMNESFGAGYNNNHFNDINSTPRAALSPDVGSMFEPVSPLLGRRSIITGDLEKDLGFV